MHVTDDIQDALDLYETDDTQWLLTNGTQYAVGPEMDAIHLLMTSAWEMTSPEELARKSTA